MRRTGYFRKGMALPASIHQCFHSNTPKGNCADCVTGSKVHQSLKTATDGSQTSSFRTSVHNPVTAVMLIPVGIQMQHRIVWRRYGQECDRPHLQNILQMPKAFLTLLHCGRQICSVSTTTLPIAVTA